MGLILKTTGANFEANAVSYIPPVADGLTYWSFLNDSLEKLARNFAPEGKPASVVGTPPVTAAGTVLSSAAHIQTQVLQTQSLTLIVVGNPVADGAEQGMFISNYTSARPGGLTGSSFGVSLFVTASDDVAGKYDLRGNVSSFPGTSGGTSTLRQAVLRNLDITKPAFLAMSIDATEKVVRLYNMSTGVSSQLATFADPIDIGIGPLKIGASPLGPYPNNPKNYHFAAAYNRKLSDVEISLIYARAKTYLASRGVSI